MKKLLTYFFAFVIFLSLAYALSWMLLLHNFTKGINRLYAGQYFSAKSLGFPDEYYIKFKEVSPVGFPFVIAVQIAGWEEEGKSNIFKCKTPIYVGYDLLKAELFISYSGEALGRYKPLDSGFGSKMIIDDYRMTVKLPITTDLLATAFNQEKSWFELVNFIHRFTVTSGNVKITDLVDGRLLYELAEQNMNISFTKQKYYTSWQDFSDHVPQRWDVLSHNKVIYSKFEGKQIIPAGIFYSFWKVFLLGGDSKFYIKTSADKIQDFATDMEVGVDYANSSSNIHSASSTLFYKGRIQDKDTNISLKSNANLILKDGFFDSILEFGGYFVNLFAGTPFADMVRNEFKYIKENKEKFSFKELENRKYNLEIDIDLNTDNRTALFNIRRFGIHSGNTGIGIINNTDVQSHLVWNTKGDILVSNYNKIIRLGIDNIYNIGQLKFIPEERKELHADIAKNFLTSISDHPKSASHDLSFAYKLDSEEVLKGRGKVGSIETGNLKPMYIFALYKTAADRLHDNDDVIEILKQADSELIEDDKIIEKLQELKKLYPHPSSLGKEIKPEIWKKLVK